MRNFVLKYAAPLCALAIISLSGCSSEPSGPESINDMIPGSTISNGTNSLEIYTNKEPETGITQIAARLLREGNVIREGSVKYTVSRPEGKTTLYCPVIQPVTADSRGLFSGDIIFIADTSTWNVDIQYFDASGSLTGNYAIKLKAQPVSVRNVGFNKDLTKGDFWTVCLDKSTNVQGGTKLRIAALKRTPSTNDFVSDGTVHIQAVAKHESGATVNIPNFTTDGAGRYTAVTSLASGTWTVTATLTRMVDNSQTSVCTIENLQTIVP